MNIQELFGQRVVALYNGFAYSKGQGGFVDEVFGVGSDIYFNVILDDGTYTGMVLSNEFELIDDMAA